jgi:ribosomal protein L3 glutamine methyltransferase
LRTLRDAIGHAAKRLHKAKLVYGHGTTDAVEEAVFLAFEGLGLPQTITNRKLDKPLTPKQQQRIDELINARITTRKPAPYLVGRAYIQGIPFRIDERVLIPRSFIGELLFNDHVVGENAVIISQPKKIRRVLDLCTGSGCLAILAALKFPNAKVDAVDLSADALELAKLNVTDKKLRSRIKLLQGDLFAPLKGERYDLIITNPPYVAASSMRRLPPEYRHEPQLALAGGTDGMDLVKRILKDAPKYLALGGAMICEIGAGRKALERAFAKLPFFWLETAHSSDEVFWLTREQLSRPS